MNRPAPRRGEIWWADFGDSGGRRPGVIVTSDKLLPHLTNVTCIVVTSRIRGIDTEVSLPAAEHNLHRDSAANCNNILTIPQANLIELIPPEPGRCRTVVRTAALPPCSPSPPW